MVNDQVMHATAKRPLLHGSRVQILNEVYTWHFPRSDDRVTPDRIPPDQAPNSSPTVKVSYPEYVVQLMTLMPLASFGNLFFISQSHRQRRQFDSRLTVHK